MTDSLDSSKIISKEFIKLMEVMHNSQGGTEIVSAENHLNLMEDRKKMQVSSSFKWFHLLTGNEFLKWKKS